MQNILKIRLIDSVTNCLFKKIQNPEKHNPETFFDIFLMYTH